MVIPTPHVGFCEQMVEVIAHGFIALFECGKDEVRCVNAGICDVSTGGYEQIKCRVTYHNLLLGQP